MIKSATKMQYFEFGIFRLDTANRELLKDGEHIALTQKSFEILQFLINNRGKMLKKDEILDAVWTENYVEEANLAQHIYMIRKVLKDCGDETIYIETVPKYGYRFIGEVSESCVNADKLHQNGFNSNGQNGNGHQKFDVKIEQSKEVNQPPSPKHFLTFPKFALAILCGLLIFMLGLLWYFSTPKTPTNISKLKSISILPFKQIGEQKDEKLGLGLADTLISRLSNQNQISILPTTTIANISEEEAENLIEVGKNLNVDAILTGTIQREKGFVRVNVQLISVQDGVPLWTDKFDAKFSDIFSLQDKVSEQLAQKLSITLKKPSEIVLAKNVEAILSTQDNLDEAIKEMRLAQKANPQSPTINTNLARLLRLNHQTDEALDYCQKAIEIAPTEVGAKVILAEIYEQKGLFEQSIKELQSVPKDAPEEQTAQILLSRVYAKKGEKIEARKILNDFAHSESEKETPTYEVATAYAHLGEKKEAVEKLKEAKDDDSLLYFLHLKYDYNIDPLRNSPEYSKILSQSKSKLLKATDKKS